MTLDTIIRYDSYSISFTGHVSIGVQGWYVQGVSYCFGIYSSKTKERDKSFQSKKHLEYYHAVGQELIYSAAFKRL